MSAIATVNEVKRLNLLRKKEVLLKNLAKKVAKEKWLDVIDMAYAINDLEIELRAYPKRK